VPGVLIRGFYMIHNGTRQDFIRNSEGSWSYICRKNDSCPFRSQNRKRRLSKTKNRKSHVFDVSTQLRPMSRIALATCLVLMMTYKGSATVPSHPNRTKPCKKMRGNACPRDESARASTNAAPATPLTRAAVSGIRGGPAEAVLPSQCLDMNGAPLAVHSHNGHTYSYVPTMKFESWHDANLAASNLSCCQAKGHLLVIDDEAEMDFVKSFVVSEPRTGWIGLVNEANDGVWKGGQATAAAAAAAAASSRRHRLDGHVPGNGGDGGIRPADCGSDSTYDDKDYMYGVRCRQSVQLPIIVEFDCPEVR
jgi:Lectin C-type domain